MNSFKNYLFVRLKTEQNEEKKVRVSEPSLAHASLRVEPCFATPVFENYRLYAYYVK